MNKEKAMELELLPNEILLDLFDYFNGTDLLQAFYGLNSRFNFLLYKQFRSYRFQFDSVSKRNFDLICQQHLPFIADRVIALQLSDYSETPEQINLFCSYIPSFRQFTHLRSLSLWYLHSYQTLLKLLDECQHLCNFTRLNLYSCSFSNPQADFQLIIDNIWSLPKVTNCQVDIDIQKQHGVFCVSTIISTSLQFVTIYNSELKLNHINRLVDYTPRLKYLSIYIRNFNNDYYIPSSLPTLIKLNIRFVSSLDISKMTDLFQSMSNLRHLTICTLSEFINGHQWEEIIRNYLPKLKTFRLKMQKFLFHEQNMQEQADRLIDSFRSSFWIDERKWFMRCIIQRKTIYLYTLCKVLDYYGNRFPDSWKSTHPHDNQQEVYNSITAVYDQTFFDQPISSDIHLPNIDYLHLKLPMNDQFWSIVPNLNRLRSLKVSSHADSFQSQLQTLLDRAPHLHTLYIEQDVSLPLQVSLFKYTNASVRRLNLENYNHYFNEEECITLTRSSLGVQCEVLFILVNNRENIIHLIKNMLNLRALIIKCADDEYNKHSSLTELNDELVQWLKTCLPSTYLIVRNPMAGGDVLIWM